MNNHLGDTNKMVSDTPRTDAAYFKAGATMYDLAGEMKRIERELNAANQRIKRLEEAGDRMRLYCADPDDCFAWDRARKDNP